MIVEAHPDDSQTVESLPVGSRQPTRSTYLSAVRNPAAHDLLKGLTPLDRASLFERLESTPDHLSCCARLIFKGFSEIRPYSFDGGVPGYVGSIWTRRPSLTVIVRRFDFG